MSEPDRSTPGRRSALLLGAALLSTMTAACTEDEHPQEESTREPRAVVDEAVALLDDAQQALDDAFPGLSWTDAAPAGASPPGRRMPLVLTDAALRRVLGGGRR